MSNAQSDLNIVQLPSKWFMAGCAAVSAIIILIGLKTPIPPFVMAIEVFTAVISLFAFGSFKYRIHKNAITYGAVLIVSSTFWTSWWPGSNLRLEMQTEGLSALVHFIGHHFLSFEGLEHLVHLDTMLFILGLTFFVAVISQTRILESFSFKILARTDGSLLATVAIITAIVSFASGILDGVSMIGLLIRVLVILLFLSKVMDTEVKFFVIMATMITTICGMWLAYGEPPNLIMKTNLRPHLTDGFFIRYCMPIAVAAYFVLYFNMRKKLKGRRIDLKTIDFFERHTADVRFLQVLKHGEVLTDIEFIESRQELLGEWRKPIVKKMHEGTSFGRALLATNVPAPLRHKLMDQYLDGRIADDAEAYLKSIEDSEAPDPKVQDRLFKAFDNVRKLREGTQKVGGLSFLPFIGLLIAHAINHDIPLFFASFAGFAVAFLGILKHKKMRKLALREASHEYNEYLFLFPLFFSIALLTKTGFFGQLSDLIHIGIENLGATLVAIIQFMGATFLSAILDNNVVADFASRALLGLPETLLHLFAMAQIAGYALGGCWTHIGSAQSVVAYSFIHKDIDPKYTPMAWIKMVSPILIEIFIVAVVLIVIESQLTNFLH